MEGSSEMSLVFDALVLKFLNVDRYANDIRYINYCIRCVSRSHYSTTVQQDRVDGCDRSGLHVSCVFQASYYSDPIALYTHIFSKGVGTRTAALYVAWAQQFEQRGMNEQADSVYQKALENQVQPADIAAADCPSEPLGYRTVITVSRSETSGTLPSSQSAPLLTVSQYNKDELVCEGSEFCFEEVRAAKYFRKIRKKQEQEQREISKTPYQDPKTRCATPSRVLPSPTVNTREALGEFACFLCGSCPGSGGVMHQVLLLLPAWFSTGVIMDMFQAPTFLDKPYESTSMLYHAAEKDLDVETIGNRCYITSADWCWITQFCCSLTRHLFHWFLIVTVISSLPKPSACAQFSIFQDDEDKENGR
ncbi:hypothetical protein XENOCAPTIV_018735 [Xenoophorus captivus]|uniref:BUB1 N-terminal domain-containing protein n=1 Tax=Xenoophorus captivus TaxID=1517983 RepID=A0ABV0RI02_9TELE